MTVTLPERVLESLRALDEDLAKAIVRVAEMAANGPRRVPGLELVPVTKDTAVILVPPSRWLRRVDGLRLAEVAPGKSLLAIAPGTPVASLEVALLDLLETRPAPDKPESALLRSLYEILRTRRRVDGITKLEILYVSRGERT